ncbi:MAG: serine hydrolase, partial [Thermoproteota archaeon]|nr:serine hydrolase [Thermoproteota archaeon]
MVKKSFLNFLFFLIIAFNSFAQYQSTPAAFRWADSVFNTLNNDERIAQLMVLRGSSISPKGITFYDQEVNDLIKKYNIGGVVLFQGSPVKQANIVNNYQHIAKTPLLICIDAEWGLGMRMDSVIPLNHQLM